MSTTIATAATTAPIVYRPLDPALGDADALAELRALRSERRAADERALAQARRADALEHAHAEARRAERRRRRHRTGHLLPA